MPFFSALFCRQGQDNGLRFLFINSGIIFIFLFFTLITNKPLLLLFIMILGGIIISLSSIRRFKDTQLAKYWLFTHILAYLILTACLIISDNSFAYWLTLLPLASTLFIAFSPSKKPQKYIHGYFGPVDLSIYQHTHNIQQRVEPQLQANINLEVQSTISAEFTETAKPQLQATTNSSNENTNKMKENSIVVVLQNTIQQHTKSLIIAIIMLITISVLLLINVNGSNKNEKLSEKNIGLENSSLTTKETNFTRLYPLTMPDNFTLFLNQYNGLTIHWQAEQPSKNQYWLLSTAQGDDSCSKITFNKGDSFRTLQVSVENTIDHYARFSPLDTQALIQAIAFRGSFSLCDFKFSLKGSQKALGKNPHYANLVDY